MATAALLARRRANEALQRERMTYVEDNLKTSQRVNFELKTSDRIETLQVQERAKKLAEADAKDLQQRREKIRHLYKSEMEEWKDMLDKKSHVSTEERIEEIRAKAFRLRDAREAERKQYVKECYDRQWLASSDEARQAESKAIMDRLLQDRTHSDGALPSATALLEEEAKPIEDLERRKRELDQRAEEEKREREQKNLHMKMSLDLQVSMKREKDLAVLQEQQREEARQLEKWRAEKQAAKEAEDHLLVENRTRGMETLKANTQRLREREQALAEERKRDELLLSVALEKERNDIANEERAKEKGKGMAREYLTFLQEQMMKDQADNSRIDALRNAKLQEIWVKRDSELRAQVEARKRIMAEVDVARQAQIADNILKIERERAELAQHVIRDIEKAQEQDALETEEQMNAKERTVENMKVNMDVAARKRQELKQEKQAALLERKELEYRERKHRERLAEIGKFY